MTQKTIHLSNGVIETGYAIVTDEERGILVYAGQSLRLHVPPEKVVKVLSEISRIASLVKADKEEETKPATVKNSESFTRMRVIDFFIELSALLSDGLPALDDLLKEEPLQQFSTYSRDLEQLNKYILGKVFEK